MWCTVGGWARLVAFGFESEVGREFVFHLLSAEPQRRAVLERVDVRGRGGNKGFWDMSVRFESELRAEEGRGDRNSDRCGREGWEDGRRQMGGGKGE